MKKKLFLLILVTRLCCSCSTDTTKRVDLYLGHFGIDIDSCQLICIVPADGCVSCINPFLEYSKDFRPGYLLVLTSMYEKSIDYILEKKGLDRSKIVCDSKNIAQNKGIVDMIRPVVYFIRKGKVIKIIDTSTIADKTLLFDEMNDFLLD